MQRSITNFVAISDMVLFDGDHVSQRGTGDRSDISGQPEIGRGVADSGGWRGAVLCKQGTLAIKTGDGCDIPY
jgi:hypothetical protein